MHRLAAFAELHHAVFRTADALKVDITRDELEKACARGEVIRLFPTVYRIAGAPVTWESRLLAACWAAGRRGFTSHRASAAMQDVPGGSRQFVVITCPRWRRAQHDGVVVHESSNWCAVDVIEIRGIPVASPALTLLQLAGTLPRPALELAFENVLRRRLTDLAGIDDVLHRYARRGRPGVRRLRELVTSRGPEVVPTASERETLLLQVIRNHGLREPVRQFRVVSGGSEVARPDFAYPEARIVIEYDSDEFHTGRVATSSDSRRRHALIVAGWLPITAVSSDLRSGGSLFCAALRAALRDRTVGASRTG